MFVEDLNIIGNIEFIEKSCDHLKVET
jgi:hypothetical protein